jgi:hypothetical protein
MMHVPEEYRIKEGMMQTNIADGNNGYFIIPHGSFYFQCIASDGEGWEHVSVTMRFKKNVYHTPEWSHMCYIKDIFWDREDTIIQYHPAESQYINNHPYVLHLWKPIGIELPIPNSILGGIK